MASDPTFRSYKPTQAQDYSLRYGNLPAYPPVLYEHIFAEHAASGGDFGFVLDVGCGPGSATRELSPAFERAVGIDPGVEMINVARKVGGETKNGAKIIYEVAAAGEALSVEGLEPNSVDLITAATAAHWFDMKKFWAEAAQLLKPGGTVAIWAKGSPYAHPDMPNAAKLNEIQEGFERVIDSYMLPPNRIANDMYNNLEMPWIVDPVQTAFPKDKLQRFDWDRGGLSDPRDFFGGSIQIPKEVALEVYKYALGTVSAVTRWREAHPELVGTERDCVAEVVEQTRQALGENGMRGGQPIVLLMFKKQK